MRDATNKNSLKSRKSASSVSLLAGNLLSPAARVGLALAAITLSVYWPATGFDFTNYDDPEYFQNNPHVLGGLTWEGVKWAFSHFSGTAAYWHPLVWLSYMVDVELFGRGAGGAHFTNILLHTANTVLLFATLRRMTGFLWRSAAVAALFALHPLQVESVAWVTERKDVLSTFFGFLSLLFYARYAQVAGGGQEATGKTPIAHRLAPLAFSLFFFTLGLLSKPMLVTWPFMMLLLDLWPLRRVPGLEFRISSWGKLFVEKIPFIMLSGIFSYIAIMSQRKMGAVIALKDVPFALRMESVPMAYVHYLKKIFWPFDLSVFYPPPEQWPLLGVVGSLLLLAGLSAAAVFTARRHPWFFAGWFLFLGTLIPVIGVLRVGTQFVANRFTYVPAVGLFIVLVWCAGEFFSRVKSAKIWAGLFCGIILTGMTVRTRDELSYWKDSETLFRHALAVGEESGTAFNNLGIFLLGRPGYEKESTALLRKAIRLEPDNPSPWSNLGSALAVQKQFDDAIVAYQTAIRLRPQQAQLHVHLGALFIDIGRLEQGEAEILEALRLMPENADAHAQLGRVFALRRYNDEAIRHYQESLRLYPFNAQTHADLGLAFTAKNRRADAIAAFRAALLIDPAYTEARNNLGVALMESGQTDEAIHQFSELLRLKPSYARAHDNLGIILAGRNQLDDAVAHFREAIRLSPDESKSHFNLAHALASVNRFVEAIPEFSEAIRLAPALDVARIELAAALFKQGEQNAAQGRKRDALASWRACLSADPEHLGALNSLAWVLATDSEPDLRNGAEAIQFATRLVRAREIPETLYTLAVAYAEAGRFDEAGITARRALQLVQPAQTNLSVEILRRLAAFQKGKAWRE